MKNNMLVSVTMAVCGNLKEHMEEVTKLWNMLDEKPEWFTEDQLIEYQNKANSNDSK